MFETTNQLFVWKYIGYPQTLMADDHDWVILPNYILSNLSNYSYPLVI